MSFARTDNIDLDLLDQIDAAFEHRGTVAAFTADTAPGTVVTGPIVAVDMRQSRDFKSGEPATSSDGRPKNEVVVTIETAGGDERAAYIPTWCRAKRALSEALGAAGLSKVSEALRPGNVLSVQFRGKKTAVHPRSSESYEYRDYAHSIAPAVPPVPPAPVVPDRATGRTTPSG